MLQIASVNNFNTSGFSFHGVTINTTATKLMALLGRPEYGDEKTQFQWSVRLQDTESGVETKVIVYDWKECGFGVDTPIYFHVGGYSEKEEEMAAKAIEKMLADM